MQLLVALKRINEPIALLILGRNTPGEPKSNVNRCTDRNTSQILCVLQEKEFPGP